MFLNASTVPQPALASGDRAEPRETAFRSLLRVLCFSQGEFTLIFADCPDASQRRQLIDRLRQFLPTPLLEIDLPAAATTLLGGIQAALDCQAQPDALFISGLERVEDLSTMLGAANFARNELRQQLPFPLVVWVNAEVLRALKRLAPDLSNWAAPPIRCA